MVNQFRGETTIKLLDGEHTVKFTFNSFAALRFKFGPTFLMELFERDGDKVRCKSWMTLRYFLWAGLLDECEKRETELTEMQVGRLIPVAAVPDIFSAVLTALNLAYGGQSGNVAEVEAKMGASANPSTSKATKRSRSEN